MFDERALVCFYKEYLLFHLEKERKKKREKRKREKRKVLGHFKLRRQPLPK